jgi:hypothetical protein
MMPIDPNEIMGEVLDRFPLRERFEPFASYDRDGDCIEFFVADEACYAERLDKWVTIYIGRESNEIVGSLIKNVRELLSMYPGFDIEIHGGRVCIVHVLRASAWRSGDPVKRETYRKVMEQAERSKVEADLVLA